MKGCHQLFIGIAKNFAQRVLAFFVHFRYKHEQWNAEHRKPGSDEQIGCADVEPVLRRHPEKRCISREDHAQSDEQSHQAADIAKRPAKAGNTAYFLLRRDIGQKGIVEYDTHFKSDIRDDKPEQRQIDFTG